MIVSPFGLNSLTISNQVRYSEYGWFAVVDCRRISLFEWDLQRLIWTWGATFSGSCFDLAAVVEWQPRSFLIDGDVGGDYDAWTADLAPLVPDSLVDLLRRGPHGLCLQCGAAVFHAAQPLFVAKTLVPKSTDQVRACFFFQTRPHENLRDAKHFNNRN